MKVTLKSFNHFAHTYDPFFSQKNVLNIITGQYAVKHHATHNIICTDKQLLVPHSSTGSLSNTLFYGFNLTITGVKKCRY